MPQHNTTLPGLFAGVGAFLLWGFLPLYWKALAILPAPMILCHRIIWSCAFMLLILSLSRRWAEVGSIFRSQKSVWLLCLSGTLLSLNWLTYIWGVNAGFVLEASMGYYINPLVNVLLGFVFFRDRLRMLQVVSILLATAGVGYLILNYGQIPWIALTLAFSFGFYGLIRKKVKVEPMPGLLLEMMILSLPAMAALTIIESNHAPLPKQTLIWIAGLLLGSGVITALPLLLFTFCARRLRLIEVGILQYLAPTCMFFLGVFVFQEPFSGPKLIAFLFIWAGVIFYVLEAVFFLKKTIHPARTNELPAQQEKS